jgi:hypothetical protein
LLDEVRTSRESMMAFAPGRRQRHTARILTVSAKRAGVQSYEGIQSVVVVLWTHDIQHFAFPSKECGKKWRYHPNVPGTGFATGDFPSLR